MTREKTKNHYGLIALLAVLLGITIQLGLGRADYRRETAETRRLLTELGSSASTAAEAEQAARTLRQEQAAPRLEKLPEARREAAEAEDLSLLMLVNAWNPMPEGYEPERELVAELDKRQYELDVRCAQAFRDMMEDCHDAGCKPYVCSAYRSQEDQEKLYQSKILRLEKEGVPKEDAPELAAQTVAVPGTSEHQLGLAVDIIDRNYPYLDEGQEETPTQAWLMENSWRYGFILRYPNGTTEITGIIYEPWHYRYVGPEYAKEIHELGLTLEEYLQRRDGR